MMKAMYFIFTLLLVFAPCFPPSFAQDSSEFALPDGAIARLGKGRISEIQYSPDGTRASGRRQYRRLALRYGDA